MQQQIATRIDSRVKKAIEDVCKGSGIKFRHFIEEALIDKLEEYLDIKDIKKLRQEPVKSFEDVVNDLKRHGKI